MCNASALSAAFDTVDHNILLLRLRNHLGLRDTALSWCKSYLSQRPQYVCIGNAISDPVVLDYSVPQGSVLGPQLFTIYTYPVRDIILRHRLQYHVYADDTQLYFSFKPDQTVANSSIEILEKCIQEIRQWMQQNFLKLNDDKTEFLLFGSRQQLSKVSIPYIKIGDSKIFPASQARSLGVTFDSAMTMEPHISNVIRSSSCHIRNIGKIRKFLNRDAAEQIVHSFITSRLDNGNSLLFGLPQSQINRLQRLQNTAARIVTLSRKSCHITPILCELHWLPVSFRITYKILLIVYKSLNGLAPVYISELINLYSPLRNLRSSNLCLLQGRRAKHSWGDRSFHVIAPRLWNALPLELKSCNNILVFKRLLKTHLMKLAFPDLL